MREVGVQDVYVVGAGPGQPVVAPWRSRIGPEIWSPGNPGRRDGPFCRIVVERRVSIDLLLDRPLGAPADVVLKRFPKQATVRIGRPGEVFGAEVDDPGIWEVLQDRVQHAHNPIPKILSVIGEAVRIRSVGVCPNTRNESPEDLDLRWSDGLLGESINHVVPERIVWLGPVIQAVVRRDRARQAQPRVDVRQMQSAVVEVFRGRVDISLRIVLRAPPVQVGQANTDIRVDDLSIDRIGRTIRAQRHNPTCDCRASGRMIGVIGVAGPRE